jgi:hypothetical protein
MDIRYTVVEQTKTNDARSDILLLDTVPRLSRNKIVPGSLFTELDRHSFVYLGITRDSFVCLVARLDHLLFIFLPD